MRFGWHPLGALHNVDVARRRARLTAANVQHEPQESCSFAGVTAHSFLQSSSAGIVSRTEITSSLYVGISFGSLSSSRQLHTSRTNSSSVCKSQTFRAVEGTSVIVYILTAMRVFVQTYKIGERGYTQAERYFRHRKQSVVAKNGDEILEENILSAILFLWSLVIFIICHLQKLTRVIVNSLMDTDPIQAYSYIFHSTRLCGK